MKVQDYMIGVTTEAMNEAFRYARATPADKLDWKPMNEGQSVLSMCRELAKCPDWAAQILKAGGFQMDGGDNSGAEMGSWATLDDCETACKAKLADISPNILTISSPARWTCRSDLAAV